MGMWTKCSGQHSALNGGRRAISLSVLYPPSSTAPWPYLSSDADATSPEGSKATAVT